MHPLKILATTVGTALLLCGLLFAYASSPAWAAIITVNSLADDADGADGECTLREAITAANTDTASGTATGECAAGSATENDIINFALPGTAPWTVNLTTELPPLTSNIEINGPGDDQLTVRRDDTAENFRIFTVSGGTTVVTISGMTISNGKTPEVDIPGFSTADGGGISNNGTLTITGSTISGNSTSNGDGGGISNEAEGTLTITGSTISGNSTPNEDAGFGGGIINVGTLMVTDSTISGNSTRGSGGGIFSDTNLSDLTTTLTNSTISGNTSGFRGGGVRNVDGLTVIEFSTITNNTAGDLAGSGGVASFGDSSTRTEVLSTIISANTNTDVFFDTDPTNSFVSKGYNLIGAGNAIGDDDPTTDDNAFDQTGDQTNVTDPKLGALAGNGGATQTHALLTGSPAIDKGPPSTSCPPPDTDQRGVERPQDGDADSTAVCDIGSFELEEVAENQAPTVAVAPGGSCGAASDMRGTINLTLADPDDPPESLTLTSTSSNRSVLPNRNISFGGGTDASRTMTVSSLTGSGTSTVTVTVSDAGDLMGTVEVRVIAGTAANNTLTGSASSDMIFARKGNDTASGQGANDLMCGGNGRDTLTGGPGADHFGGGSGTDTATDFNAGEGDTMAGIP